jgi:hypothetical protein
LLGRVKYLFKPPLFDTHPIFLGDARIPLLQEDAGSMPLLELGQGSLDGGRTPVRDIRAMTVINFGHTKKVRND